MCPCGNTRRSFWKQDDDIEKAKIADKQSFQKQLPKLKKIDPPKKPVETDEERERFKFQIR